ncbi:hypothetical protein P8629_05135 [Hydrogenovibrio sp. 3SP14C1]|uniref:hypothetical protein n=1 Tax=Hydrogenovibrio sp. 3SP14C1 TaxID=3038774 RepID=UPI0024178CBC|nr:hypothetical protein [Hydrogenovibrio sp. 3SP14C1]MDG4812383.1 hypothetical protein [Hydrogenovibrio sp. 3SP14C1]
MRLRQQLFTSDDARKIFLEPTASWQTVAGNPPSQQNGINHLFFYDEEAKEFLDAFHEEDKTEQLDALGDMLFVAWGITHHLNLPEPMAASQMSILYVLDKMQLANPFATSQAVFEEVVRSNFSKFCKNQAEAEATVKHYDERLGVNVVYDQINDFFVIRSNQDQTGTDGKQYRKDKILKSVHFSEPDFSHI